MIVLIQSVKELILVKKKVKEPFDVLALNLEVATYCKIKKIKFVFPFDGEAYHSITKKILLNSKKLLDSINLSILKKNFLINEARAILRYKFNQTSFLIESVNLLKKRYDKIVFTNLYSNKKFFEQEYINIEDSLKILKLENILKIDLINKVNEHKQDLYSYSISGLRYKNQKKIILNNAGYNFKNIFSFFIFKKIKISIPKKNLNFFKKILFYLMGFELYEFVKTKKKVKNNLPEVECSFFYDNYDLSDVIKNELNSARFYLGELNEKYIALNKLFILSNIKLAISNTNRDIGSMLVESASENNVCSISISHGTISKSYDAYDKIYKEYIAEGVFLSKSNIKTIQSKINKKSLETLNVKGKIIETGNLVFSENIENSTKRKEKILYAVTNKRLPALQVHGVEYYFEFYNNLQKLNELSKKNNYQIIVHLHPGIKRNINNLKKIFKNLIFRSGDISKSLKQSFLTISYSSTVIEDSLYNKVPVVLLDLHKKKYIHFKCERDPKKTDKAMYYIDDITKLESCIETINKSKNIPFDEYIYLRKTKKNISKLFQNLI